MVYLGKDYGKCAQYELVELLGDQRDCLPALIDRGQDDEFLAEPLKIDVLESVVNNNGLPMIIRQLYGRSFDLPCGAFGLALKTASGNRSELKLREPPKGAGHGF